MMNAIINKSSLTLAVLAFALVGGSAQASLVDEGVYEKSDVVVSCVATNGVEVKTNDAKNSMVTTKLGQFSQDFRLNFNPTFGAMTWLTLSKDTQIIAEGYQVFLFGNAVEGQETTLTGAIGRLLTMPLGPTGMVYPAGFVPLAGITCRIGWIKN